MPLVQTLVLENRILRRQLKAGLDDRKISAVEEPLWPLMYLSVKLLRHEEALELLASSGFGSEAGILLRTMFEAAVNIRWITKDTSTMPQELKRYSDYQFVSSKRYRDYVKDWKMLEDIPEAAQEEWGNICRELDKKAGEIKDEYNFNMYKPWSGKTLKQMANEVGWGERYATLYQIYSDVVHSGITAVPEYLVFDKKGKVTQNFRSQTEHCKFCLYEGQLYLLTAFGMLNILLDLKLDKVIEDGIANKTPLPNFEWPR